MTNSNEKCEWQCPCKSMLPFWGTPMVDGNIRCQNCKRVFTKEGKNLSDKPSPVDEQEGWEKTVNDFIRKWCGENAAHLLDSDENDGERLRQTLSRHNLSLVEAVKKLYVYADESKASSGEMGMFNSALDAVIEIIKPKV